MYREDDPRFIPDWRKGRGGTSDAHFGKPTDESVLLWGDRQAMNTTGAPADNVLAKSDQLVYVQRGRPTSYDVMVLLDLSTANWTGETNFVLEVDFDIGIGKAHGVLRRIYTLTGTQLQNGAQAVQDLFQVPARSISATATLGGHLVNGGEHACTLTVGVSPVFE